MNITKNSGSRGKRSVMLLYKLSQKNGSNTKKIKYYESGGSTLEPLTCNGKHLRWATKPLKGANLKFGKHLHKLLHAKLSCPNVVAKVMQSLYRPGVAQRVPGS
jgi:hypothetical protein